MHAVERRRVLRVEIGRDGLVREQHEFFDQPVRDVAVERDDRFDRAAGVDHDFRFVQIEVDRTAAAPRVVEDLEQLAHQLEHRHERRVPLEQLGIAVGQDAVDAGVGHPLVAVDHPVVEFRPHDFAGAVRLP